MDLEGDEPGQLGGRRRRGHGQHPVGPAQYGVGRRRGGRGQVQQPAEFVFDSAGQVAGTDRCPAGQADGADTTGQTRAGHSHAATSSGGTGRPAWRSSRRLLSNRCGMATAPPSPAAR